MREDVQARGWMRREDVGYEEKHRRCSAGLMEDGVAAAAWRPRTQERLAGARGWSTNATPPSGFDPPPRAPTTRPMQNER